MIKLCFASALALLSCAAAAGTPMVELSMGAAAAGAMPQAAAKAMPYNEAADAKAELREAMAAARQAGKPVLLVFGANWCEDCRALDKSLHQGKAATLMQNEFRVVKVDVGRFDRNMDLSQVYGEPTKRGIPAAVLLSPDNAVLYATRAGELADARAMSEDGIYRFFRHLADKAGAK